MKVRAALLVGALLVATAAVLCAQGTVVLDTEFEAKLKAVAPGNGQAFFDLALQAFRDNMYAETEAAADKMLAIDAGDTRALYLKKAARYYQGTSFIPLGGTVTPGGETTTPGGETTTTTPAGTGAQAKVVDLSDEQVDKLFEKYGAQTMNEFRQIQNATLIRRCASNECHGDPKKSAFYIRTRQPTSRKTLAENLTAVEPYLNRLNPTNSRLLEMTLAGPPQHPGGPVFRTERDAAYQQMLHWIQGLPGMFE